MNQTVGFAAGSWIVRQAARLTCQRGSYLRQEEPEVIMHPHLKIIATAAILNAALSHIACADDGAKARSLINSQGCKACHALEGDGGVTAGSFEAMREELTRDQVRVQLVNPQHQHGNDRIADFSHLSEKDIDALVHFIQPKP